MELNASDSESSPTDFAPTVLEYSKPEPSPPVNWYVLFWVIGAGLGACISFCATLVILVQFSDFDAPPGKSDASDWGFAIGWLVAGTAALGGFAWRIFKHRRLGDRRRSVRGFVSGFLFGFGALTTLIGVTAFHDAWTRR
jgi:hypothetical protein